MPDVTIWVDAALDAAPLATIQNAVVAAIQANIAWGPVMRMDWVIRVASCAIPSVRLSHHNEQGKPQGVARVTITIEDLPFGPETKPATAIAWRRNFADFVARHVREILCQTSEFWQEVFFFVRIPAPSEDGAWATA